METKKESPAKRKRKEKMEEEDDDYAPEAIAIEDSDEEIGEEEEDRSDYDEPKPKSTPKKQKRDSTSSKQKQKTPKTPKKKEQIRKDIQQAFPYAKYGNNLDNYAYKRVKPALNAFKTALFKTATTLKSAKQYPLLLEFCKEAVSYIDNMPDWNNVENHKLKDSSYTRLNPIFKTAITSVSLSQDQLKELKELLDNCEGDMTDTLNVVHSKLGLPKVKSAPDNQ